MNEVREVFLGGLALIPTGVYAFAYSLGGRDIAPLVRPRLWRRVIAPMLFSILVILLSVVSKTFKPMFLISIPAYVAAHWVIGYGGDKLWVKLLRRLWTGLVMGLAALTIALCVKSYGLFVIQIFSAVLAHLVLGLINPTKASFEEVLISALTVLFVPYMVL